MHHLIPNYFLTTHFEEIKIPLSEIKIWNYFHLNNFNWQHRDLEIIFQSLSSDFQFLIINQIVMQYCRRQRKGWSLSSTNWLRFISLINHIGGEICNPSMSILWAMHEGRCRQILNCNCRLARIGYRQPFPSQFKIISSNFVNIMHVNRKFKHVKSTFVEWKDNDR